MKNVWYQLKRLGKASLEETMCFLRGEEGVGTVEVILILVANNRQTRYEERKQGKRKHDSLP